MELSERAEYGATLKASGKCNCTRAVLTALQDLLPLTEETIATLTAGFAAGMGTGKTTCGALIGAVMAAGMVTEGQGAVRLAKTITERFEEKCGALVCRDLKGVDTKVPLCSCPDCVKNAILALGEALAENGFSI